jgi:hypothetical protein
MNVALLSIDFFNIKNRWKHCRPERSGVERCMTILNQRADANGQAKVRVRDRVVFMGKVRRQQCK